MSWPCLEPEFPWSEARSVYLACTNCGRVAWEHEQADPLADVRNTVEDLRLHRWPPAYPVMKP